MSAFASDSPLMGLGLSWQAAKAERARRNRLATERDSDQIRARCRTLAGFVREAWHILEPTTEYVHGWHIDAICEHLEAVTRGEITRLLINVPPGAMKSLLTSVLWPAWEWGPMGMPHLRYLTSSYSGELALRDNVKMRRLVESEWYQTLWPEVKFAKDQNAKTKFENTSTGGRECRSFEHMTGGRGDRVIIDDPHAVKGGESEQVRTETVKTFRESITDRLNNQAKSAIVVIMQRVHMDDVSGTIIALGMGYVHLMIPMEYEPARSCCTAIGWRDPRTYDGELMCPERWARKEVEDLKRDKGAYAYAGQYQQRPAPREGGMFLVDKITLVEHAPIGGIEVRGWDIAGSTKKTSPFTAGARLKQIGGGDIYIVDMRRGRLKIGAAEQLIVDTAFDDGPAIRQSLPQDPGSAGLSQKNQLAGKLGGLNFRFTPETGTKEDRAIPFASQVEAGKVYMVRGAWNSEMIEELRNFPTGTFKDQVDALSRAYSELLAMGTGFVGLTGPRVRTPEQQGR